MNDINLTPARNQNIYTNYEKAKQELENLFANLAKHEEEKPGQTYGYAGIPHILKEVREKGIDKIFFVGRDYHGKYEDDYCYFTYWDEVDKKFIEDEWGTWAAFPSYDLYEMPISFTIGWELGLIDKKTYLEFWKNNFHESLAKVSFEPNVAKDYKLRVKVEGGRKWKGEGYLIDVTSSSYRYATPMYRSRYYGTPNDFGVSTTETAVIWDPITNTINRANYKYVKFVDAEKIMEKYIEWANKKIDGATVYNFEDNSSANRYNVKLVVDWSFDTFMAEVWSKEHNIGDVSDAYDPEMEAKKKKESEFRASKMPGIIEWVKNNTDKEGEDIITLALHIYNKNYGKEEE